MLSNQPRLPLTMSITVCIADNEPDITYNMAKAWETATLGRSEVFVFDGNHYFILEHFEEVSAPIARNGHKYNTIA